MQGLSSSTNIISNKDTGKNNVKGIIHSQDKDIVVKHVSPYIRLQGQKGKTLGYTHTRYTTCCDVMLTSLFNINAQKWFSFVHLVVGRKVPVFISFL